MKTFADKVISFNKKVDFKGELPDGIRIMNPFKENKHSLEISSAFYKKYYDDFEPRHLIIGINPGRFGAGITGVPFTDTKRLLDECGLEFEGKATHDLCKCQTLISIEAQLFHTEHSMNTIFKEILGSCIQDNLAL